MRKKWKYTAAIMLAAAVFCTSVPVSAAQDAGSVEAEENTDGDSGDTNEGTIEETPSAEECDLSYRVHVQTYGWQDWKADGETAGTSGESKRLEAIQIRLTGEMAEHYDVYYRVHIQSYGWLPYVQNGAYAGSEGFSRRLEALELRLVEKNSQESIETGQGYLKNVLYYSGHVQNIGDIAEVQGGNILGVIGQEKRLEAFSMCLKGMEGYSEGSIEYTAHVQGDGWQDWKSDGERAGTNGEGKRIEAVKICLKGQIAELYDIYYRAHIQNFGWLDWAKNAEIAGTTAYSYRMEAIFECGDCISVSGIPKRMRGDFPLHGTSIQWLHGIKTRCML